MFKLLIIVFISSVFAVQIPCSNKNAIKEFEEPVYRFSMKLLDRVAQQTHYHFVFSPISSWLLLVTLAEGTKGRTKKEISRHTEYNHNPCLKRKFIQVLNGEIEEIEEVNTVSKRQNVMVFDNFLNVSKSFQNKVKRLNGAKLFTLNFRDSESSADVIDDFIIENTDGVVQDTIQASDFDLRTLLTIEAAYLRSDWKYPFKAGNTEEKPFYSEENVVIGQVNMMTQIGYFNMTAFPSLNAKVLELPFQNDLSMLVLLPDRYQTVMELYYKLKDIKLRTILNSFDKAKLINVSLPRFSIRTEVENMPELLYDMGIKKIFFPDWADFKKISEYKMYSSMMKQVANIEVTEKGVTASAVAEALKRAAVHEEFSADKPFAYLLVDRKLNVVLFAGIYKDPTIY